MRLLLRRAQIFLRVRPHLQSPPHRFFSQRQQQRVVVGMSGGVDSSVTAHLLKSQGYDVIGVYMKNWDDLDETGVCTGEHDERDARAIATQLGIRFEVVNYVKEYWTLVFDRMVEDYAAGLTPNPDIFCNREIKFKLLLSYALNNLQADYFATGHYARIHRDVGPDGSLRASMRQAADPVKDQTYFLAMVLPSALHRVLFPLGDLLKSEVRKIAEAAKVLLLSTALSFIPSVFFPLQ